MLTAVIGHGRSPEGRGWAPRIDSCDVVVRMWDWHWQSADYGMRYDYGVLELHPSILARFGEHNCRHPVKGWLVSDLRFPRYRSSLETVIVKRRGVEVKAKQRRKVPYLPEYPLPPSSELIDFRPFAEEHRQRIGGVGETGRWELTRGAIAASWAVLRSKPGDAVVLVGCDNMRTGITAPIGDAFSPAYLQDVSKPKFSDYVAGATKSGNHDFPAERRLVEFLAAQAGVAVHFAQDVW